MDHKGCQEGKATPKMVEIKCPVCGTVIEIFVRMGGGVNQTGRVMYDETCEKCGYVVQTDHCEDEFEKV